jgi:hypothetical protein
MKYFSNWAMGLITALVNHYTRPRTVGLRMMAISGAVLVGAAAGGYVLNLNTGSGFSLLLSSAEGPPAVIQYVVMAAAVICFLLGATLAAFFDRQMARLNEVSRILVAELRGLVDTSDRPLKNALPPGLVGRPEDCLVDVRQQLMGPVPNVQAALDELALLGKQVRRARGDTAREHVTVVAGGVMQVPLLFYAGTLLDDEGTAVLMDWERNEGRWKPLDQPDDGQRFMVTQLPQASGPEVVLAVSASYLVDLSGISQTFPGLPFVHMKLPDPKPNTLWSEQKQVALTAHFLDSLADLANKGVTTVHLVLAASSSLSLRFGRAYDPRNHPNLRCYQRERDHVPPYPWSVRMPTALLPVAYLTTPAPPPSLPSAPATVIV